MLLLDDHPRHGERGKERGRASERAATTLRSRHKHAALDSAAVSYLKPRRERDEFARNGVVRRVRGWRPGRPRAHHAVHTCGTCSQQEEPTWRRRARHVLHVASSDSSCVMSFLSLLVWTPRLPSGSILSLCGDRDDLHASLPPLRTYVWRVGAEHICDSRVDS